MEEAWSDRRTRVLEHHPDLNLADLQAAWAYYESHREEIDQAIEADAQA
jgi:uncharacterized protein (DUF433 family)